MYVRMCVCVFVMYVEQFVAMRTITNLCVERTQEYTRREFPAYMNDNVDGSSIEPAVGS